MRKKMWIFAAIGFPIGVLIAVVIAFLSGEKLVLYSWSLLERTGSIPVSVGLNILLCGLYGAACMVGTQFYEVEEWSLLKATVLHYLVVVLGSLVCFLVLGWGGRFGDWLIIAAIQTVIFFLIWLFMFLRYRAVVKELNELNQKRHGDGA